MLSRISLVLLCAAGLTAAAGCPRSPGDKPDSKHAAPAPGPGTTAAGAAATSTAPVAAFALGYQSRKDEQPIAEAQAVVRASPDSAQAYVGLAKAFLNRKRETGEPAYLGYAGDALQAAAARAPEDPEVLTLQALLLFDEHRFQQAADLARRIAAAKPEDSMGYLLLSDALLELGAYDAAVDALQQAMDRRPDLRTHSRTAYLRWLHGDHEGALESMDDALQLGSRQPEPVAWCHVDLGWLHWQRGKLEHAAAAADQALALVPDYLPALSLQAQVLAAQGMPERAMALLERVVARLPTAEELLRLADLLQASGRAEDAAQRLAQAERLAAHDPLPLAVYYARHGLQPQRALELADKALAERPTIFAHDARALALVRLGRIEDAAQAMTEALKLQTQDARLLLHRGLIELAAGQLGAARSTLAAARQLNPHADPWLAAELAKGLDSKRGTP